MPYLIWDFDGTLAQREGLWTGALVEAWEERFGSGTMEHHRIRPHLQAGFPWHQPQILRTPGTAADEWWERLFPVFERAYREAGKVEEGVAKELARKTRLMFLNPERWRLFDDTLHALDLLSAHGWRHVILSNHVPELGTILQKLHIDRFFERIFNSAETGAEKPHPEAFANVLRYLPKGKRTIMIGDNIRADIQGARNAGIEGILVRGKDPDAEQCCADLYELVTLLGTVQE